MTDTIDRRSAFLGFSSLHISFNVCLIISISLEVRPPLEALLTLSSFQNVSTDVVKLVLFQVGSDSSETDGSALEVEVMT